MTIKEIFPKLKVGMRVRIKHQSCLICNEIGVITKKDFVTNTFTKTNIDGKFCCVHSECDSIIEILSYAVSVKTKDEWDAVVSKLLSDGWVWCMGEKELLTDLWDRYKEESAINISEILGLLYLFESCYKNVGFTIISAQEFLGEVPHFYEQYEAGYITEIGELTEKGKNVLMIIAADNFKKELTERAKAEIEKEKNK